MKKLNLSSLLLPLILLTLLFSCDKVELDEITNEDQQKIQKIDLNSDANLQQLITNLRRSNSNLRAIDSHWDNLDTENIVGYMKENGLYNYSIPIKSTDHKYIEYLKIAYRGDQYFGYVLQYEPSGYDHVKGFDNFTGLVRLYDLDGQLLSTECILEGIQQDNIPDSLVSNQRMTEVDCRYATRIVDVDMYEGTGSGTGGITVEVYILCEPVSGSNGDGGDSSGTNNGGDWGTPIDGAPIPTGGDGSTGGSTTGGDGPGDTFGLDDAEALLNSIENETDSDIQREKILTYIDNFGGVQGKEFVKYVRELLNSDPTPGAWDQLEINQMVWDTYLFIKAQYIAAIFSPDNVATILALGLHTDLTSSFRSSYFRVTPRYLSKPVLGRGYTTFHAFKNSHGVAGAGKQWHHIVAQRSSNISKFGANQVHNTKNLVKIEGGFSGSWHSRISSFYLRKNPVGPNGPIDTGNLRFGQWLAQKTFQEQMEWGLRVMQWTK